MSYWLVKFLVDGEEPWEREFETLEEVKVAQAMMGPTYYVLEGTWMHMMKKLKEAEESLGSGTSLTHSGKNMKKEDGK